jgi:hypothetical protein
MVGRAVARIAAGVAVAFGVAAAASPANASCSPPKVAETSNPAAGRVVNWSGGGEVLLYDAGTLKGRVWQYGSRATANGGTCDTSSFLVFTTGYDRFVLQTDFSSSCFVGCPAGRLAALAEETTTDRSHAGFLIGTVDETPSSSPQFDYSIYGIRFILEIVAPHVSNRVTSGTTVSVDVTVDSSATAAAFGSAGADVITGYNITATETHARPATPATAAHARAARRTPARRRPTRASPVTVFPSRAACTPTTRCPATTARPAPWAIAAAAARASVDP